MGKSSQTPEQVARRRKRVKLIKTVFSAVAVVALSGVIFAANTLLSENSRIVSNIMGSNNKILDNSGVDVGNLNLQYYQSDFSREEISAAQANLEMRIASEGMVLTQNNGNFLPLDGETTLSFFSVNSVTVRAGASIRGGGVSLLDSFSNSSMHINQKLWDFYTKASSSYGLGPGSISYGDSEDFTIHEVPLADLLAEQDLMETVEGTIPVYFMKRVAGEGRDMPRSMYAHSDDPQDRMRNYIEPDSTELEIITFLNDNFDDVILVINSNAAMELGWVEDYTSIKSVIFAPDGLQALPQLISGEVNPSGRLVDTFASDALASPAAQNFGSYYYFTEDGEPTKYNYISYLEGIYVGYKYYETRYEDFVMRQGNAGSYDYTEEVVYPFGFGMSYTSFQWANYHFDQRGDDFVIQVDVTNTGEVAGKDVVQVYLQSPYTDYDREFLVEKPSVELVGYEKTPDLQPGETQTVTILVDGEQLKAYDYVNAQTYILDAGDYYFTLADNAHTAINNILSAKGYDLNDGMTAEGQPEFVTLFTPENETVDTTRFSRDSHSGVEIVNLFDEANGGLPYLSRQDWTGTWPAHDGTVSMVVSDWGNEINGIDANGHPASFAWYKTVSSEDLAKLAAFDSGSPINPDSIEADIVYNSRNGLSLIDMRGLDFDDPQWTLLLDQLHPDEYYRTIGIGGYGIEFIESINMPFIKDADTASGLIYGGTGKMYPNMMTLAQTWNPGLALEYGHMIGSEAVLGGADGWYAPSMNIHRTPFSGRNGEYYSEDAFLSGRVAEMEIRGAGEKGLNIYIKHFAFNDQENHRGDRDGQFGLATWLNEQAARELYLVPFEMSIKAGTAEMKYVTSQPDGTFVGASRDMPLTRALMTGFNRLGYTWTGGSYPLITGLLRTEWDFNGIIITDNANTSRYMDGYQMIEAGSDIKLTSLVDSARFDFDKNNPAHYVYARNAMHRFLYNVANSKAMNGAMPGSVFIQDIPISTKVKNWVNIIAPILIAVLLVFTVLRFVVKTRPRDIA